MTPKNTLCLWYDGTALDAAEFYASDVPGQRGGRGSPGPRRLPVRQAG